MSADGENVRVGIVRAGAEAPARARTSGGPAVLRFGVDHVLIGCGPELRAAGGAGLREHPEPVAPGRLHVVVQKGRLFQRSHPEAKVLLDRGRFLLVDIDPDQATAMQSKEPCFTFYRPEAIEGGVVFEASAPTRAVRTPDPAVQALVARVSRAGFEADLAELVALPTRLSTSAHFVTAADQVAAKLLALGYRVTRQKVQVGAGESANVIARARGTWPAPRGMVLVTAHLDSINHEDGIAAPAPGADDDGSGSAGVVAIARALAGHAGRRDLVLILFGGEEQGLLGSQHYVRSLSPARRARVRAVVNMDMIGRLNVPVPTVLLEGRTVSQGVIDSLSDMAATYTGLAVETSLNAANSDHVPFLDNGIPAVLTIEGADSTNDDVHSARDTLDRIDFALAEEILKMNVAFVATALAAP